MRGTRFSALYLVLAALAVGRPAHAQSPIEGDGVKFWITFVDKKDGPGRAPLAVEPGYVTARAKARRLRRGRSGPRAHAIQKGLDTPVSPYYVARLRAMGIEPVVRSRWLNAVSAYLTPQESRRVSELGFVRSVTPVARTHPMTGPDGRADSGAGSETPTFPNLTAPSGLSPPATVAPTLDYGPSLTQLQNINAVQPIEDGFIGSGVLLGFLDTRTDTLHPVFEHLVDSGRIVATRDFTVEAELEEQSNKHGLFTSSTAMGFDEGNLIGPCYGGEYILATTEYAPFEENQEEDFFVAGMEWLELMGADVVNVSLGYSTFDPGEDDYTYEDMDGNTAKTTIASDIAVGLGVAVVVSAGNAAGCGDPNSCWYYITSPADGDSVITAGAVTPDSSVANFSSRGPTFDGRTKPDVAAPGTSVRYATGGGGYSSNGAGTSFSSPLVAGVACQILQADPGLNPIEVRSLLRSTASQAENPDNEKGWGIINAAEAVRLASLQDSTAPALSGLTISPDTADVTTGDVDVDFLVRAGDSLSGVREVELCLADPSGNESCQITAVPDSGDANSGRWTVPITIPKLSETGRWRVSQIVIEDSVVSSAEYDSTALAAAGFPTDVDVVVRFDLSATVLLEGAYSSAGMMTAGGIHLASIPLHHPFDTSAYAGTPLFFDGAATVDSMPSGAVDWLLLSLRSDTPADSTLASSIQPVLLMEDGSIVDTLGADPTFFVPGGLSWYVVVRTRNHGAVMTPVPVDFTSGHGVWDFTDSLGAAFTAGPDPLKELEPGHFGMFACDIDFDGQITASDFNEWLVATKAVKTGYLREDCDLDGQATVSDFNLWLVNTKAVAGSQVP